MCYRRKGEGKSGGPLRGRMTGAVLGGRVRLPRRVDVVVGEPLSTSIGHAGGRNGYDTICIRQAVGCIRVESCPTQAVLPLVGLAAEKVIRDRSRPV
ncbi:MAG: hypothetical protein ACQESR_06555 [Planctomycetota bacterium]